MSSFTLKIPKDALQGLRPKAWVVVGPGFAREEVKRFALEGGALVSEAVTTFHGVAAKIAGIPEKKILGKLARQEVLRMLLSEPRISAHLNEIRELRQTGRFLQRIDHALQSGRMAFAHAQEEEVIEQRLRQTQGRSRLREELRALTNAYETWLKANALWDPPMLLRHVSTRLREEGWPPLVRKPEKISVLSTEMPEALEREFSDALQVHLEVERVSAFETTGNQSDWKWIKPHSIDDGAEFLGETLYRQNDWKEDVVLVPDSDETRRSLKRAFDDFGIPLTDSRDPLRLKRDELLKWALIPLEVVASDFEKKSVIAWVNAFQRNQSSMVVSEIEERGIVRGLKAYSGGKLESSFHELCLLRDRFPGRQSIEEISKAHLFWINQNATKDKKWVIDFFESAWTLLSEDLKLLGQEKRRARVFQWLRHLRERMDQERVPIERIRPNSGIEIYRISQAPVRSNYKRVWIFGLSQDSLNGSRTGDDWFSSRERELLSAEFAIRSRIQARDESRAILKSWLGLGSEVIFVDPSYDSSGRERESIFSVIRELAGVMGQETPLVQEIGAHPRWVPSMSGVRSVSPTEIALPPMGTGSEITASALDRYSRCGFQALALYRWKLKDIKTSDFELWPEARGSLLHHAVKLLLQSRDGSGVFSISAEKAIQEAWERFPPRGLLKIRRARAYAEKRLIRVLQVFCEQEVKYLSRAKTKILSLDEARLEKKYPAFNLMGTPDRVDLHPDGIFVMDYKTSSDYPSGADMVELGYRLQLPFYALACHEHFGKEVLGAQFIELSSKGSRNAGILFRDWNGKEEGKLSNVRSNSKSLISKPTQDVWHELEAQVVASAEGYFRGCFKAMPRKDKECTNCFVSDFCGLRRQQANEASDG